MLRDTKLSMYLRDLKAAYLTSPHFKDIYLNLTQNKVPLGKGAARTLEQNARNYMLLDGLLFKIIDFDDGRLDTVLCIPNSKVHILLDTYHSSLIGGHTGITKCYCYIVGLGLNCKFIDLLFKHSVINFIEISSLVGFIVPEIIYSQTDTLTEELMDLR